jgi:predicted lipid-binding transport protein (Tim44 family)
LNKTKFIAALVVFCLILVPTLSFARARGGSSGGYSSGSRSSAPVSMGSRGSRTYNPNGAKPIEQSTTAKPAATPGSTTATSQPTAASAPAQQPSFFQRNPLMAGLAAGLAGSWLGHMLFGATDSTAATANAEDKEKAAPSSSSNGLLILLMLLGVGAVYLYMRSRRAPVPDFSGMARTSVGGSLSALPSAAIPAMMTTDLEITQADKAAFQQLLVDIQTAWGKQDLTGLRRFVTPEMLTYFSEALAEDTSLDVANHVSNVVLLRAEVRESWTEDDKHYATVGLHWSAIDYTLSLSIPVGEPGHLVEGSQDSPIESSEVWTFMRHLNGKWLLSAVQQ